MLKHCLIISSLFALSSTVLADTIESGRDVEDNDIRALKEWIDTKRQISLKEIGGDLSLSGEVRTEFQNTWENNGGRSLRGSGIDARLPARGFDIEFNLMLDYRTDRTWASVKVEFDNSAGIFNGTLNKIALERAYWGARAVDQDTYTFDIEVGRQALLSVFDSKIQFGSFFDGILFRYDRSFEKAGDFYLHFGPFVINEFRDHFGYIGEVGFLNLYGTGFYTKLSVVDWDTKHYREKILNRRFNFVIPQLTLGYRFQLERPRKIGLFYVACLRNFAARQLSISDHKRANWGGYVGVSLGKLLKQGDWAVDINYQIVAAQAIPDFDVSGIGNGGANRFGFYTTSVQDLSNTNPTTRRTAQGNTNYRGFALRLDILLTDKLDMQQSYMQSISLNSHIGPFRTYKQYELEFIYSW